MNENIKDYPSIYWIVALTLDAVLTIITVLISLICFYIERDKFFKNVDFRNKAIEIYEEKKKKEKKRERNSTQNNCKVTINNNKNNINNNPNNNNNDINNEISNKKYTYQNYLKRNINEKDKEKINTIIEQNGNRILDSNNRLNTCTILNPQSNNNFEDKDKEVKDFSNRNTDFGEDIKNVEKIEKGLLKDYRYSIRFAFVFTILTLLFETYSNIATYYGIKPRFLDKQFILYNDSYLVWEENLIIEDAYSELEIEKLLISKNKTLNPNTTNNMINTKPRELLDLPINTENMVYTNIQKYRDITLKPCLNITIKPCFDILECKSNTKSDLNKIDFLYKLNPLRYAILIINSILDLFIIIMSSITLIYKVEINKLYKSKFITITILFLNKTCSMSAVIFSYFDLEDVNCLNKINYFDFFFYAYIVYILLFCFLIIMILIYSFLCRQFLYYILFILISGLTLFIVPIFCLEKMKKFLEKIYIKQEYRLKHDLESIRNFKFKRDKQKFQLLVGYIVILLLLLTGLAAFLNFGILKFIWIENSIRTCIPAIASILSLIFSVLERI